MLEEIDETPADGDVKPAEGSRRRREKGAGGKAPEPGQQRELEEAPQLLRKASVILLVGSLFPWLTALSTMGHMPWKNWAIGIALTLLAGFLLIEGAKARSGLKANGLAKSVAGIHPMAVAGLAGAIFLGAVVFAFMGKAAVPETIRATEAMRLESAEFGWRGAVELAALFLAVGTFAHILAYEYGGKFNPIFPLMFLGPALAGLLNVWGAVTKMGDHPLVIVSLIGSAIVAAGGMLAMYTMYMSMRQAKVEGDKKREMQREYKKKEREARRARS